MDFMVCKLYFNKAIKIKKLSKSDRKEARTAILEMKNVILKLNRWGFPGGTVVKNLPANAEDKGSIPGPGRHATEQLSPCTTTTEPAL